MDALFKILIVLLLLPLLLFGFVYYLWEIGHWFWAIIVFFGGCYGILAAWIGMATVAAVGAGVAAGEAIVQFIDDVIDSIINFFSVKQEVSLKCPNAFKAKILEKQKNAVNVGIYAKNNDHTQTIRLSSDYGVSDDLRVGQEFII